MDKRQESKGRTDRGTFRKILNGSGKRGMDEVILRGRREERE
jgi:hypothetical protein